MNDPACSVKYILPISAVLCGVITGKESFSCPPGCEIRESEKRNASEHYSSAKMRPPGLIHSPPLDMPDVDRLTSDGFERG